MLYVERVQMGSWYNHSSCTDEFRSFGILFMTPGMGVVNFSMYFCLSLCFLTSIDCYLNVTGVGLLLLNFIIINENL